MGSTGTGHLSDYSGYRGALVGVTGGKDLVNTTSVHYKLFHCVAIH